MNAKFDALPETDRQIVYVKPVLVVDLPEEVQAEIGDLEMVYSVNRQNGERLALVRDRAMAFLLARQHDLAPVNVH